MCLIKWPPKKKEVKIPSKSLASRSNKQTNQDWYDITLDKIGFLIKVDHSWPPKKIEVEIPFRIAESNANLRRQEKAKKRFVECAKKKKKKN